MAGTDLTNPYATNSSITNSRPSCEPGADKKFGPLVDPSCRFDFTLFFEQVALTYPLSLCLLLLATWRIFALRNSSAKTLSRDDSLLRGKFFAITSVAGLQLALLILWSMNPLIRTLASLSAAASSVGATLALYILSYYEHTRSIRPSTLIVSYIAISLLFDIIQARTLHLLYANTLIAVLFSVTIGAKLAVFIMELADKRSMFRAPYSGYPSEATGGILKRSLLLWLNPLFVRGFRRLITIDDLADIDPALSSELLRDKMQLAWDRRTQPEGPTTLLLQTMKCLIWPMLRVVPFRISMICFFYSQPLLFRRVIDFVQDPHTKETRNEIRNEGLILVAATALVYIGYSVSTVLYRNRLTRINAMLRAALIGVIFNKALVLDDTGKGAIASVTLMSTDIDRIVQSLSQVNELWAGMIRLSIGLLLLAFELGPVWIVPIIILIIVSSVGTIISSRPLNNQQMLWSAAIEKRVDMTGSVLAHMSGIRMMGLASFITAKIHKLRHSEVATALRYRWLSSRTGVIANTTTEFGAIITFAAYEIYALVRQSHHLPSRHLVTMTTLSIITLITDPATSILTAIPITFNCKGSFERIQKFLLTPSRVDYRILPQTTGISTLSQTSSRTPALSQAASSTSALSPTGSQPAEIEIVLNGELVEEKANFAVAITNLTVRPSSGAEPAVLDLSMQLRHGTINILAGPVGSGKSTLMRAILGELPYETGSIQVSGTRMAFCAQTPWLINATIREVICGVRNAYFVDEKWYEEVKLACALDEDIAGLANADETVVGCRGMILSGGQKQRVALARAIYAKRDVILLDDVLSALDSKTETLVVGNLLGPGGLLRRQNSTVLLITHTTRHFHLADHIVVLGRDGRVAQQGTFEDFRKDAGSLDDLLLPAYQCSTEYQCSDGLATPLDLLPRVLLASKTTFQNLTPQKRDNIAIYKYYVNSVGRLTLFALVASALLLTGLTALQPNLLGLWIDSQGHYTVRYINLYFLVATGILVFRATTWGLMYVYICPRYGMRLHSILLKTTMSAPQSYLTEIDTGVTLNRFSQDLSIIDRDIPYAVVLVTVSVLGCIAQCVTILVKSYYMAIPIVLLIFVLYWIQRVYLFTSRQLRVMDLEARGPVYSHLLETLEGLSTIRAFGWQDSFQTTQIRRLDRSQKPYYLSYVIWQWLEMVLNFLVGAIAVIVVALPVAVQKIRKSTTGSSIGIVLISVLSFSLYLSSLIDSWTWLETSMEAISRLKDYETEVVPEDTEWEIQPTPMYWPNHGHIEFREVYASYGPTAPALSGISISVMPGQRIGICGRTGSGKSSLLLTLLRLLEIDSGSIFIDGIDIQTLPRETVRTSLIVIPQNPFIIDSTFRKNADPSGLIHDYLIIEALMKIHLWDIIKSRGGLGARMTSQPLSQGQQQLFCLARAILKKKEGGSKVVILDEATSNVDAETDQLMQRVVREEFNEHTILIVAHRIDTIMDADRVAVLEGGRVVEFGGPGELVKVEGSRFGELCRGCAAE